jgi:hypothetical protein
MSNDTTDAALNRFQDASIEALVAEIQAANNIRNASTLYSSDRLYATYRITAASRALAILTSPQGE